MLHSVLVEQGRYTTAVTKDGTKNGQSNFRLNVCGVLSLLYGAVKSYSTLLVVQKNSFS